MRYLLLLIATLLLATGAPALQVGSVDSVVQFLLTSAATDFHAHRPPTPVQFRNVRFGHFTASGGEQQYLLCGEFLPAEGGNKAEWAHFATIKTSGYEQWIGGQAISYCLEPTLVWEDVGDLSSALLKRIRTLQEGLKSPQLTKQDSIWLPLRVFVGSWMGKGGGEPGIGEYARSYKFVLNKKYIEIRNKSSYPPTTENPKGEVHEDLGYLSYDKSRRTFVLRQFHIEGFVNQYKLESISTDGKKLVFVSEAIENIPAGWRAKESYEILNDDQIQETFELAGPDKPFAVYTKVILNRVK